jgi:hypothetical protein
MREVAAKYRAPIKVVGVCMQDLHHLGLAPYDMSNAFKRPCLAP